MSDKDLQFEDFLNEVNPIYRDFVNQTNDFFLQNGCKIKVELAKNGYVVSYSYNKRVIANYVFRKSGMIIRIYGEFINKYNDFIETLPSGMIKSIEKAPVCKRLIDPTKCNSRCSMGYDFTLKGTRYQKCKYNSFMFEINDENIPFIKIFLENEFRERMQYSEIKQ